MNNIYLDHNATTPLLSEILPVINSALLTEGNASSVHAFGREARRIIEEARESLALLLGAKPSEVIFTSGGTESNNLALKGIEVDICFAPATEHLSVLCGTQTLRKIPVDQNGVVLLKALEEELGKNSRPVLVSIMLANNETGVIQPVKEVAELSHKFGALVHCDAVQGVGKIPCNFQGLDVDLLSVSGHKIGAPQGVGALVIREGLTLNSINEGGGQEKSIRSGTENLPGIAGFGAAALLVIKNISESSKFSVLRDKLEKKLKAIAPIKVFGCGVERLPNTTCFTMPGVAAETQVMALDLAGISVSSGAACSSGKVGNSHVLLAMGACEEDVATAIRVSFGRGNKPEHIELFEDVWADIYKRAGKSSNSNMVMVG